MWMPVALGGLKRASDPLGLKLQRQWWATMQVLGLEPGSSGWATSALNHWVIYLSNPILFYNFNVKCFRKIGLETSSPSHRETFPDVWVWQRMVEIHNHKGSRRSWWKTFSGARDGRRYAAMFCSSPGVSLWPLPRALCFLARSQFRTVQNQSPLGVGLYRQDRCSKPSSSTVCLNFRKHGAAFPPRHWWSYSDEDYLVS